MKTIKIYSILIILVLLSGCAENSNKSKSTDINQTNMISVKVPIEGMSCMACVAKVKNTLSNLSGVNEAKVSLENKSAIITYNPNQVSLDKIKQSINETGYKAGTPKKLPQ